MRSLSALLLCILSLLATIASAGSPHSCSPDGVAVGGYDLVSYHQAGGPTPGTADLSVEYEGLTYQFSKQQNLDTFVAGPESYLPRYRGWCAATLAMGRLACPDYTNFKIEDGELLLFELAGFTNGRTLWNSDPAGFRSRADANALELIK